MLAIGESGWKSPLAGHITGGGHITVGRNSKVYYKDRRIFRDTHQNIWWTVSQSYAVPDYSGGQRGPMPRAPRPRKKHGKGGPLCLGAPQRPEAERGPSKEKLEISKRRVIAPCDCSEVWKSVTFFGKIFLHPRPRAPDPPWSGPGHMIYVNFSKNTSHIWLVKAFQRAIKDAIWCSLRWIPSVLNISEILWRLYLN
jgi:hypothetical protein